jgi:hypothetical protein
LDKVEEYDPATDTWTTKPDIQIPRKYLKAEVINGKVYAIGGNSGGGSLNTVEEYNPVTGLWTLKMGMINQREGFGIASYKRLYICYMRCRCREQLLE